MNIYNIGAEQNFLCDLAKGVLSKFTNIDLHNITIFLPTKRSCIKLAEIFADIKGQAIILPNIIPLQDINQSHLLENSKSSQDIISKTQILLLLNKLLGNDDISLSSGIAKLIERLAKDEISLDKLKILSESDSASHVTQIISHLNLVASSWPKLLASKSQLHPAQARNLYIVQLIKKWENNPPAHPVIVAGSTGSIKSTAKLLNKMNVTDNCYVVIRGLDPAMSSDYWSNIEPIHPFYYIKSFLEQTGIDFKSIPYWYQKEKTTDSCKTFFIQEVFRPYQTIEKWQNINKNTFESVDYITIAKCNNLQEEALYIATEAKNQLTSPSKQLAIICNNYNLTRTICNHLQSWNINVKDLTSKPLLKSSEFEFLSIILELSNEFSVISLLKLLKHPLFKNESKNEIYDLETKYLRGIFLVNNLKELVNISNSDILGKLYIDLEQFIKSKTTNLGTMLTQHLVLAEKIASAKNLWSSNAGQKLYHIFADLFVNQEVKTNYSCNIYYDLLLKLLEGETYFSNHNETSNITIISSMESRLFEFDKVIIADFVEGSWPVSTETDPWFNKNIESTIGLTPSNYKIGQAAQDFYFLAHAKELIITLSTKSPNGANTPSRWLTRLESFLSLINKNRSFEVNIIRDSNDTSMVAPIYACPPLTLRPTTLSVTTIEKLMRDPYGFYAKKILNLKPLEEIDREPDQSDFGSIVHSIIDQFNNIYDQLSPIEYLPSLENIITDILRNFHNNPVIHKLWKPRLYAIAKWLINFEQKQRASSRTKVYSEISGEYSFNIDDQIYTITAKADRIEVNDGFVTIMDFKTGAIPTANDILLGYSPQLTLEALIAAKGKYKHIEQQISPVGLVYLALASGEKLGNITNVKHDLGKLISAAEKGIIKLLQYYSNENTPYIPCLNPEHKAKYNEYAHLERDEI